MQQTAHNPVTTHKPEVQLGCSNIQILMATDPTGRPRTVNPLRVALRTYAMSLSLSLFPAILPVLASPDARSPTRLREILRREVSPAGFAFAMTLAIAGGRALDQLWDSLVPPLTDKAESTTKRSSRQMSASQRTFLVNILSSSVAILLLTFRHRKQHIPTASIPLTIPSPPPRGSPTLDLTLLLLVRALDARTQSFFRQSTSRKLDNHSSQSPLVEDRRALRQVVSKMDAFVFWLACSRIMWCFFYQPERLPHSYVKWITSLANMDSRLLVALRAIREGSWQYARPSPTHGSLLTSMASDLNLNPLLGDPSRLPAHGGAEANKAWAALLFHGRRGVGGIPCQIVHNNYSGNSCTGNALLRGLRAFGQALLIYTPVHVLPVLLVKPTQVFTDPIPMLSSLIRSASFLSTFVSSVWFTVCFVRTLFVARFFPHISHNFLDGPQGCILAGCLACGASIGIERDKRRGEIALYVLPRAIRACLPYKWVKSGSWSMRAAERLVFVLSLASILTTAIHQPDALRGLSRWTIEYIMSGTSTKFWKRRWQNHSPNVGDSQPNATKTPEGQ